MSIFKSTVITAIALTTAVSVWAAEPARPHSNELASAKQKLARTTDNSRGAHRQELLLEQQKLQGLIDDVQSGKRVDPADIDRALENAERDAR